MESEGARERWESYRKANTDKPQVRRNELQEIFTLLSPKPGEFIFEVGTGNGYLTFPIARAVVPGKVLTADVSEDNLESVRTRNKNKFPIQTLLFDEEHMFSEVLDNAFHAVASIATLHHFDNEKEGTGERGRTKALREMYRVLKPGGRLVLADVAERTSSHAYFDAIDDPEHCYPEGHPFAFFSPARLKELLEEIGFEDVRVEVKEVPWQFTSEEEAQHFIHTIHNAKCSAEESFDLAKKLLAFKKVGGHYELGWELCFVTAIK